MGRGRLSEDLRYPRPAILDAIDPSRHAVLEASAGTGKTYTLEHLVVELVLVHGVPLEQILVVTFTDKATREMRERVRAKLRDLLDPEPSWHAAEGEPAWTIDADARRRVGDALAVFDRAPISTIHSFCQRVLTESAFDCARLLRQEQVESRESFGRAFREELRVELSEGAPLRPVLERAIGAWGVDRLEASLHRWYAERGEPEPRFDRERAGEALGRLPTRRDLGPGGMAARVLAEGLSRNPKKEIPAQLRALAPTVEAFRAGGSIYEALLSFWDWGQADAPGKRTTLGYVRHYLRGSSARSLAPLADLVEQLGQTAGSPLTVLVAELLPRIVARLTGRKAERGHFDFDDMLQMLRAALFAPGGESLVGELRRRYRVALVDEFQDTDRVQWDIFRRVFFDGSVSSDGSKSSDGTEPSDGSKAGEAEQRLFLIGDPKQAIYGFRNADVHTYHAACAELEASGGQVIPLTVCYRSSQRVIDAVNMILEEGFFTGINRYPHPVVCGRPQLRALEADGRGAAPVKLFHFVGRPALRAGWVKRAYARRIALEIGRLLDGGLRVDRGEGPVGLSPSDIHVLCRSKSDADGVGAALAEARIPHAFYKREGLFQTPEARHVWEVLRAVEDPDDTVRRLHAWLTPFFAVPLERLAACRDVPPTHPLAALLHHWRALAEEQRWTALFSSMLEDSGLARRELFASASERALTDTQHILELLLEETHRGRRSLSQLIGRLGAFIEGRELPMGESGNVHRLESERRAVQILTMHKSKGLEAEVVFLVGGLSEPSADGLAPRIFHDEAGRRVAWIGDPTPEVDAGMKRDREEEAQRLLYVALTRAKQRLYLPYFGSPPPGVEHAAAELSYELEPIPAEVEVARPQLDLFFEDPQGLEPTRGEADEEREYEMKRMSGPYHVLNDRLRALVERGETTHADPLLSREEVLVEPEREASVDPRVGLYGWRPPAELLSSHDGPGDVLDEARFDRARRASSGFDVTSYTRMKSMVGGYRAPEATEGAEGLTEDALVAASIDNGPSEPEVGALPGGSSVGVFLHEVLELLPFEAASELVDGAALLAIPAMKAMLEGRARANGVSVEHVGAAADLVMRALRAPLVLADGARLEGLCRASRRVAEMPFLHPIPERAHPSLTEAPPGPDGPPLAIERGFIRGVIDLVFEHEGRFHVVDYKSDRLRTWSATEIAAHVERNYLVQARLYTLGTLRALGIHDEESYERRFGGLVYMFLRGMSATEPGSGVWTFRPKLDEVLEWERTLCGDTPWGYPLPPRRGGSDIRA